MLIERTNQIWRRAGLQRHHRRLKFEPLEARRMLAVNVVATVETAADSGEEDDIAIWIHPTDPSQSRVIGTVKTSSTSLRVYNLAGQQVQSVSVPQVNNVDLRYNFSLSGQPTTIVAGSNRSSNSIVLYKFDAQNGLQNVAARTISTGISIYGCAMYVSPTTGKYYVFVSSESGQVQQWELVDNGAGKVNAMQVRSFSVGSTVEGLVADDQTGKLYVAQESSGIWRYSAESNGGTTRESVDTTGSGGHLDADVEGLAIYYAADGTGYLIASSQGNNEFAVYQRGGNNAYVNSFKIVSGGGIDAVADTDGIDVTNFPLGSAFPQGMFVAQDSNDNFKFVKWEAIDAAFGGGLLTDTAWDPRLVGAPAVDPNISQGDYNSDGAVDAADYVIWRKLYGANGLPAYSAADGNGNQAVDDADYNVWRYNYGGSIAVGVGGRSRLAFDEAEPGIASVSSRNRFQDVALMARASSLTAPKQDDGKGDEAIDAAFCAEFEFSWLGQRPSANGSRQNWGVAPATVRDPGSF